MSEQKMKTILEDCQKLDAIKDRVFEIDEILLQAKIKLREWSKRADAWNDGDYQKAQDDISTWLKEAQMWKDLL